MLSLKLVSAPPQVAESIQHPMRFPSQMLLLTLFRNSLEAHVWPVLQQHPPIVPRAAGEHRLWTKQFLEVGQEPKLYLNQNLDPGSCR